MHVKEAPVRQKHAAAIHDISGLGRCSLTVALPILSAAGIQTSVIPTAVLSTHTGGFTDYTYRDLTADMKAFSTHWRTLNLTFDAIYSGYLGSFKQLEIVSEIFSELKSKDTLIMVDPVMGDHGELYSGFTKDFAAGMKKFCGRAGIIVPNITEACFMLNKPYKEGPYEKEYIEDILYGLSGLGPDNIVLTGVFFDESFLGAAIYDKNNNCIDYALDKRIGGMFHGTGDVFGSALLAALLNGFDLYRSAQLAVKFTSGSIERTYRAATDPRFGVDFEQGLPELMKELMKR